MENQAATGHSSKKSSTGKCSRKCCLDLGEKSRCIVAAWSFHIKTEQHYDYQFLIYLFKKLKCTTFNVSRNLGKGSYNFTIICGLRYGEYMDTVCIQIHHWPECPPAAAFHADLNTKLLCRGDFKTCLE